MYLPFDIYCLLNQNIMLPYAIAVYKEPHATYVPTNSYLITFTLL